MDNISYFKLQAKNLFRDFKSDYMKEDAEYNFSPKFFDINSVIMAFDIDCNDFSLMKAQHIIAKIVGFKSWDELIKVSDILLQEKKENLNSSGFMIKQPKIYHIDLSGYEKVFQRGEGDYIVKCPRLPELEEIICLKPDCYFMSNYREEYSLDKAHIYVNVLPKTYTIRVLVPGVKYPDWYAVSVKNI